MTQLQFRVSQFDHEVRVKLGTGPRLKVVETICTTNFISVVSAPPPPHPTIAVFRTQVSAPHPTAAICRTLVSAHHPIAALKNEYPTAEQSRVY